MRKIYAYATEEQVKLKVEVMYAAVQESIEVTKTTTLWQRIQSILIIPRHRRALSTSCSPICRPLPLTPFIVVACDLQAFQQVCGFNTLMYYSATLFKSIGFNQPTAVGLIVAGTNFLFTLVALKYIDIIGRLKIILISASGMIIGLVLASVSFHCKSKIYLMLYISLILTSPSPNYEHRKYFGRWFIVPQKLVRCSPCFNDHFRRFIRYRFGQRPLATRRALLSRSSRHRNFLLYRD